jgi:hypothetical protein
MLSADPSAAGGRFFVPGLVFPYYTEKRLQESRAREQMAVMGRERQGIANESALFLKLSAYDRIERELQAQMEQKPAAGAA